MTLRLPSFLRPLPRPELPARVPAAPPGAPIALLVDHEEAIRGLLAMTLRMNGYHVIEAEHAGEALERVAPVRALDLLIAAVNLRGMDGTDLASMLRMTHKHMHVIFVPDRADDEPVLGPNMQVLMKPFTCARLMDLLAPYRPGHERIQAA